MNTTQELGLSQNDGSGMMPEVIDGKVDARSVHEALQVKSLFNEWINRRITDFGFVEGEDYYRTFDSSPTRRNRIDYELSIDMAKELAMVERNEMGRKMRRYFIECEKRVATAPAAAIPQQAVMKLAQLNGEIISELGSQSARISKLETAMRPGPEWRSPSVWVREQGIPCSPGRMPYLSGRCTQKSGALGLPIGREQKPNGGSERRTFAPQVLEAMRPLLERWARQDAALQELKGGAA